MAIDASAMRTTDPLSDVTIRMMNDNKDFIMGDIFTPSYVKKANFKWYQYGRENLRRVLTKKSSKAEADKVEFSVFNQTGLALLHKLGAEVDPMDEREVDAPLADLETTAALQIGEHLLMDFEQEGLDLLTTTANYASGLVTALTSGTNTWIDPGGDPIGVIKDLKNAIRTACGKVPLSLATAYETMEALRVHPGLIQRIQYTGVALPDTLIMTLLGLQEVFVARAINNSSMEGQADVLATMWADNAVLFYRNPTSGLKTMSFAKQFLVQDFYTYRYDDQKRGSGIGRIKVIEQGWEYALNLIAKDSSSSAKAVAGGLITNTF